MHPTCHDVTITYMYVNYVVSALCMHLQPSARTWSRPGSHHTEEQVHTPTALQQELRQLLQGLCLSKLARCYTVLHEATDMHVTLWGVIVTPNPTDDFWHACEV